MASECGKYVSPRGGGSSYPCTLEGTHDGPHMAKEIKRSVIERQSWERDPVAYAEEQRNLATFRETQGEPKTWGELHTEPGTMLEHPAESKRKAEEARVAAVAKKVQEDVVEAASPAPPQFRKGTEEAIATRSCRECADGNHDDCIAAEDAQWMGEVVDAQDGYVPTYCGCFLADPTVHLPFEASMPPGSGMTTHGVPKLLIGLSGYAQAGKDTIGQFLVNSYGFKRIAFADRLKDMALALDPLVHGEVRLSRIVENHGWDNAKERYPEVRRTLQRLATEVIRDRVDPDYWLDFAFGQMLSEDKIVITDVRFPNEIERIHESGGVLIRIERPGINAVNAHSSEMAWNDADFDYIVTNDASVEDLYTEVEKLLGQIALSKLF